MDTDEKVIPCRGAPLRVARGCSSRTRASSTAGSLLPSDARARARCSTTVGCATSGARACKNRVSRSRHRRRRSPRRRETGRRATGYSADDCGRPFARGIEARSHARARRQSPRARVSLENVRIMGSRVGAVCAPARAMLLTGRSLWRAYAQPRGTDAYARPALGESLRRAGTPPRRSASGTALRDAPEFRARSERAVRKLPGRANAVRHDVERATSPHARRRAAPSNGQRARHRCCFRRRGDALSACELARVRTSAGRSHLANWRACHSSEVFADSAVALMNESRGRKPLFLYVAFTAPHDPFSAPTTEHLADTPEPSLPETFRRWHKFELESVQEPQEYSRSHV